MAIKTHRPTSPGKRHRTDLVGEEITKKKPEKSLTASLKKHAGRSHGKITVRRRGGGAKRRYRIIDFKRDKRGILAKVTAVEYDPNRSANIALLTYTDGEKRYILAPKGLKIGDEICAGEGVEKKIGNAMPLKKMPIGAAIHNIELTAGKGGQLVRGAGNSATLMSREGGSAQIRLPSGEIRLVKENCYATLGQVGRQEHSLIKLGKAGRSRHLRKRPKVRGTAMPAGEHPHGGGEGRTGPGRPSKTYKGKPAHGKKTRKKKKYSNKYIVQRRR
ncbi:MAG: 50S ribosomal protein L2 [Candidatus Cloacimonetes bacterium]|nr:50S ribosomal protein L2 [Candidatus Cloacimonadota bacterium]